MNSTTNKRNLSIGGIEYATKFASKAKPFEIFMNKSVTPNSLYYKDGDNSVHTISEPTDLTVIQNDLTTLQNIVNSIPESPTTTTVNISSAQILGGFTSIPCLPANNPNEIYDIEYIIYFCDNANYTFTGTFGMNINGASFLFKNELLNDTGEVRTITGRNPHTLRTVSNVPQYGFIRGDRDVNIGKLSGLTPTGGTGNITIKIQWKLIDISI